MAQETLHESGIMQGNTATSTICSNLQDQLLLATMPGRDPKMSAGERCQPDDGFGQSEHAPHVNETADDTSMECSLDLWEKWLEATSPSNMECINVWENWLDANAGWCGRCAPDRRRNIVEMENANMECSLGIKRNWLEALTSPSATMEKHSQYSPNNDQTSPSSACKPNISPPSAVYCSINSSMPSLPTMLIESDWPVCSNTYPHDSHPLADYMNNHGYDHLDINKGIHDNTEHSMGVSLPPILGYQNEPLMCTASAASAHTSFVEEGPHFAAISIGIRPPPQQLYYFPMSMSSTAPWPPPNLTPRAVQSELNLEARSKQPPLHLDSKAVHTMDDKIWAIENSGASCEARETVTLLVESSTRPAIGDGYRWCKYGQKKIKGKLHPRCYFKCAQRQCPVKKQTECSSSMPGFVFITYLGRHNHFI